MPPETRPNGAGKVGLNSAQHGISRATFYAWRKRFGGLEVDDAKRLKALEDENRRLKRTVADLSLDKQMLKDVLSAGSGRIYPVFLKHVNAK